MFQIPKTVGLAIILLVIVDALTKAAVRACLSPGDHIDLIGPLLRLHYVRNVAGFSWWVPPMPGWAEPVFQVMLGLILLASIPCYRFYTQIRRASRWADLALVGVAAGLSGHLLEGLFLPFTTDFLQVLDSPSANPADLYSFVGIAAILIEMISYRQARPRSRRGMRAFLRAAWSVHTEFLDFIAGGLKGSGRG
jgi:lipoprotein signal peptidase